MSRPQNRKNFKKKNTVNLEKKGSDGVSLNKFIANSGICSRREADVLIKHGSVEVIVKLITEMGYKVKEPDVVKFDGTVISPEQKQYILLINLKDYITTMDDRGRKTYMEFVGNASKERIYPVGRLDRNTAGLLLFTNDGDLAKRTYAS